MVYKKYYCGQRSGKTIRKQHMTFQSNDGYVEYRLLQNRLNDRTADKVQKFQDEKDKLFPDGRIIPAVQDEDDYPELYDLPLNFPHRQGNNVLYSLDKYKRWSLPAQLQNTLEPLSEVDFRVVLYERKTLIRRRKNGRKTYHPYYISNTDTNDCVKYLDSKTSPSCAGPRGSAASFFCDLREKCLKGDNSGRKVLSRRRGRHNMHNRGIQRKSELHRQYKEESSEEHHLKHYYLNGLDNKDTVEFRYEICAPGKKTTRSKWFEKSNYRRLADRIPYYLHFPVTEKKALSKLKSRVNSQRGAWQKWQLKMEIDEMQDSCARVNHHSDDAQMNREKDEEMNEERTALNVNILDCLQKTRQIHKTAKRKGYKRKTCAEDLHVDLEKKNHIVYLDETSKADEDEEDNGSDSSVTVLVNEVNEEEEVPFPNCARCSLKKSNMEDLLRRSPGSRSRTVYPAVHHLTLLVSDNKDENENFECVKGNGPVLEVQQTFNSALHSDNRDIAEYRLRILGDHSLHLTDKKTEELDQKIMTQERGFLNQILSAETIFQLAKNIIQQYNQKK